MIGVGIDFGTTNSVLAVCDGQRIRPLLHEGRPHPSIVWFRGDRVTVGKDARAHFHEMYDHPGSVFVRSVKRYLGRDHLFPIFGDKVPAWRVASHIFTHIREDAREVIGDTAECVVTVPVHFDGRQRRDIRRAAEASGFFVKAFVPEPFAAFVGYAAGQGWLANRALDGMNVLVFDWGGGTLDITLISMIRGEIREIGKGGINDVAGDLFDDYLQKAVRQRFLQRYRLSSDVRIRPRIMDLLTLECEQAKIALSTDLYANITVPHVYTDAETGQSYNIDDVVTRDEFEALIHWAVERAVGEVERVLEQAGLVAAAVDLVLMIGGTSLIPLVDNEMRRLFGSRVVQVPNAATVIAEGAAVIHEEGWLPSLAFPVSVLLSDNTHYTVFDPGTPLIPEAAFRDVTFFCTDPRDGDAKLVMVEGSRASGRPRTTRAVIQIPVSSVNKVPLERVYTHFEFDRDQILHIRGHGSIVQQVASSEIIDLCIGLRLEGETLTGRRREVPHGSPQDREQQP